MKKVKKKVEMCEVRDTHPDIAEKLHYDGTVRLRVRTVDTYMIRRDAKPM